MDDGHMPYLDGSSCYVTDNATLITGDGVHTTWALTFRDNAPKVKHIIDGETIDDRVTKVIKKIKLLKDNYVQITPALPAGYQVTILFESEPTDDNR